MSVLFSLLADGGKGACNHGIHGRKNIGKGEFFLCALGGHCGKTSPRLRLYLFLPLPLNPIQMLLAANEKGAIRSSVRSQDRFF